MEYIYAALMLHKAEKEITENALTTVLKAGGIAVNESRVKALIAALDGVNIEEAIAKAAVSAAPAAVALSAAPAAAAAVEEVEETKEEEEEEGMAGLGALFG